MLNHRHVNQHTVHYDTRDEGFKNIKIPSFASEVLSSSIASTCGLLLGHPFETVKVRLQTQRFGRLPETLPLTARRCARELVQHEGVTRLWRGMTQQFISAVPAMAVMFFAQDKAKKALQRQSFGSNMDSTTLAMLSGAVAGGARVIILTPFDLLKTRAQAQKHGQVRYMNMAKTLYRQQGLFGFYRGFSTMALRNVPSCATYFYTFEKLKQIGEKNQYWAQDTDPLQQQWQKTLWTMNSGGLAGVASWTIGTPQDMIKTKQQTYQGENPLSIMKAINLIRVEGGLSRMFRSMPVLLTRGYIVSFVSLPLNDYMKQIQDKQ